MIPSIETSGILFFGEPLARLKTSEIGTMRLTLDAEVHCLRHFHGLVGADAGRLVGQTMVNLHNKRETLVTMDYLTRQIQTVGAKFHPQQLIQSPLGAFGLAQRVLLDQAEMPQWFRTQCERRCVFSYNLTTVKAQLGLDPALPLGTANLVSITEDLAPRVYTKMRGLNETSDQQRRLFVEMEEMPTTNNLVVVLSQFDGEAFVRLVVAHPGMVTPPFPNARFQSPEEFAYNSAFWSRHAFVEV